MKEELAALPPSRDEALAELHGLVRAAGSLLLTPGGLVCEVRGERAVVPRRVYRLCRALDAPRPLLAVRRSPGKAGGRFVCRWAHAGDLLIRLHLLGPDGRPRALPPRRLAGGRLASAFLRGFFLGAGSVDDPARDHHLELDVDGAAPGVAEAVLAALASLGIAARDFPRRGRRIVYLKDGAAISECLAALGAAGAVLRYEEQRIRHEVRAQVNRLVNAETANLGKSGVAGLAQIADIHRLEAAGRLAGLPAPVRDVAAARLAYPEASLRELGGLLRPPVGKSAVQYRIGVIRKLARRLGADPGARCNGGPAERG